jgi:thiol-disulfide isomerase/thioredoxin
LIGEQVKNNKLSNMDFLSEYTLETLTVDRSADVLIGEKVPKILLRTFDNDTIDIRSLESKVVLLDFWEMWCGACLQSLPKVHELSRTYSSKGFITIGIISSNIDAAKIYLGKKEISFLQVQGNTKMETLFKVNSFPRYVLIDKKGIIKHVFYGYSDDIEKKIRKLISI